ncbi:MAG: DNA-binding transcriptional regulator Fis [Gammaproteobacteria bacterium]|nr:DNA-binding transcriptional regulator Fis [Gammaproteobacteria bacterium]
MNNVIKLKAVKGESKRISLNESVKSAIAQFLSELDGEHPDNIYDLVMQQVEEPLLELVLDYVDGNQSKAAECLGINRGTLRKKLKTYELIK